MFIIIHINFIINESIYCKPGCRRNYWKSWIIRIKYKIYKYLHNDEKTYTLLPFRCGIKSAYEYEDEDEAEDFFEFETHNFG